MKRLKYNTIAWDYDGVLCYFNKTKYPYYDNSDINLDAFKVLRECKARGQICILFTCRTDKALEIAVNMCKEQGIVFDSINCDTKENIDRWRKRVPNSSISNKVWADIYIDDKAYPNNIKGIDWYLLGLELAKYEEI